VNKTTNMTFIFFRYTFDVGIHYIGEMEPCNPKRILLDHISDGQIEWSKMDKAGLPDNNDK
jgi:hypothetical protein